MMVIVFSLAIVAISVFEAIRVNNQVNTENK
jgi:hypothetical protein